MLLDGVVCHTRTMSLSREKCACIAVRLCVCVLVSLSVCVCVCVFVVDFSIPLGCELGGNFFGCYRVQQA